MTDLMTHVESIVRPVRATQSRKLRMRRELLAHLQSACEEELSRNPDAPLDRAKHRLGPPASLTAQLQQSVPSFERLLLTRLPTPRAFDQWESKFGRRLFGPDWPPTLAHTSLLIAASFILPYTALLLIVFRAGHPSTYRLALINHPVASLFFNLFFIATPFLLILSSSRFITTLASPRPISRRAILLACSIPALLFLTLLTCILGLARRPLTPADLLSFTLITSSLLLTLTLTGRLLATLTRPYRDWLTPTPR